MDRVQPKVISNSSPLIYLAKIGRLNLIKIVYRKIWIPEAVFNEAVTQGKIIKITDASIIEEAVCKWILEERISSETDLKYAFLDENNKIGLREMQALKLCKQLKRRHLHRRRQGSQKSFKDTKNQTNRNLRHPSTSS